MKKRGAFLAAVTLSLVLSASLGSAGAYFTTHVTARGGYPLELGNETTVHEEFDSWTKHVTVTNREDSQPVYVRVRAFAGSEYTLQYSDAAGKWTPGEDGYYYYSDIVNGGESTGELHILIGNIPQGSQEAVSFNVAVVYESTPVLYDENGSPYADWSVTLDSGEAEGGAG